jgi:citrate synthase
MNETQTAIGQMIDGEYHLRGKAISALMSEMDFLSAIWFILSRRAPTEDERKLLNACFVASIDHGVHPPSAHVARIVASCGKSISDAVAAGLLTLGSRHGNAAGAASTWIREAVQAGHSSDEIVRRAIDEKYRLPGLGHPEYDVDPRAMKLIEIAKANFATLPHCDFALEVSRVFSSKKGKPLPLNIDGALGAVVADLGAPAELADAIFIISRTVGLIANAREEAENSVSYRRG